MCKASKRKSPNDAKRYIKSEYCTADGELAQIENFSLNQDMIDQESRFDGFYGICTDLEGSAPEIIKINGGRWIIENGFRTMKTDLRARPVYLKRDDRNLIQCKLKCKTDKVWNEFETIQSDIFDHLIAMSSEFGLKMYQLSV